MSNELKDNIIQNLLDLKKAFNYCSMEFVLQDGLVLGYARHGDVLDHDFDVDIGVFQEYKEETKQELYRALRSLQFGLEARPRGDFIWGKRGAAVLDLWYYHKEGNYYIARPRTTPGQKWIVKAKWFDNPKEVDFLGTTFLIPNHTNDYLDCRYDTNWRDTIITDRRKWDDIWESRSDLCPWHEFPKEDVSVE